MSPKTIESNENISIESTKEYSGDEIARWAIPLLKEYAEKLAQVATQIYQVGQVPISKYTFTYTYNVYLPEVGRLICLNEVLTRRVVEITQYASSILEHAKLVELLKVELGLRLEEVEEGLRFNKVAVDGLVAVTRYSGLGDKLNEIIERSGRYKSPV